MLVLHRPSFEEMSFRQELLADDATMSYNHAYGGCIDFSKEKWENWYEKWLKPKNKKYYYRYLYEMDSKIFIGECAFRFDEEDFRWYCDVIIHAKHRGKGYGREGLQLLCEAAKAHGLAELYDNIAIDNSAVELFLRCGFTEVSRDEEAILVKKVL